MDRPLAYFTFALNWYWGQNNVVGYHLVNITIHTLTTLFLFYTLILLFQTPILGQTDSNNAYFFALLSAALWGIHPIQIQAVTYIVQRMAALAALFYLIGIFCYLKARLSSNSRNRFFFFGGCGVAFLLGLSSKNNAIVLPVALILLEFIFFQDLTRKVNQKKAIAVIGIGALLVALSGVWIFMDGDLTRFYMGYEKRPFTMYERLLTQPRIILFYLSQIFYPIANRFSIAHDFPVSSSLFSPWTTLPSILLILFLISISLWRFKKNPLLTFAVLFYFGNHVIESSILPLEMVFEHRNYLPSLFLFVPISVGIKKALDYYYIRRKAMFYFLTFSICAAMIGIGTSTYIRNWDWRSTKSIWEDAREKAPNLARPLQNIAWGYYAPTGQIDKAVELYKKALSLKDNQTKFRFFSYNNLADIYYSRLHDYEKAVESARKATKYGLDHVKVNFLLCYSLSKLGRYNEAMAIVKPLVIENKDNSEYRYVMGFLHMKMFQYEEAYHQLKKCIQLKPNNWKYLREFGICLTQMGYFKRGYWYLKRAESIFPGQTGILLALSENRIKAGKTGQADKWIDRVIDDLSVEKIEKMLTDKSNDKLEISISYEVIELISNKLDERANEYSQTATRLTDVYHFSK